MRIAKNVCRLNVAFALVYVLSGCVAARQPQVQPKGAEKSATTELLEAGAAILQPDSPLDPMNIYLAGFHPMKHDPAHQMEAHHFCRQVNKDFSQCVLFDGNTREANLNGIEYIISERLFESLPEEEKKYWHPHNYEILSGQLVAPGIPKPAEEKLMREKMNSYGKTWHVWNTGSFARKGDKLPLGDAMLAWSFNRDGEAKQELIEERDKRMDIDTQAIRRSRRNLRDYANPQQGVNALKGQFPGHTEPIPGVLPK